MAVVVQVEPPLCGEFGRVSRPQYLMPADAGFFFSLLGIVSSSCLDVVVSWFGLVGVL